MTFITINALLLIDYNFLIKYLYSFLILFCYSSSILVLFFYLCSIHANINTHTRRKIHMCMVFMHCNALLNTWKSVICFWAESAWCYDLFGMLQHT